MTSSQLQKLIDQGAEFGWHLNSLREERVGWVLLIRDHLEANWMVLIDLEKRMELESAILVCPFRVSIIEFDREMYQDGSYSLYPEAWTRNETYRFRTFQDAMDWLRQSGYRLAAIRSRSEISAP